jgi:hypothetical protein
MFGDASFAPVMQLLQLRMQLWVQHSFSIFINAVDVHISCSVVFVCTLQQHFPCLGCCFLELLFTVNQLLYTATAICHVVHPAVVLRLASGYYCLMCSFCSCRSLLGCYSWRSLVAVVYAAIM